MRAEGDLVRQFVVLTRALARKAKLTPEEVRERQVLRGINYAEVSLIFSKEEASALELLLSDIQQRLPDRFSNEYLERLLFDLIRDVIVEKIVEDKEELGKRLEAALDDLEHFEEHWRFLVPIEGLVLKVPELEIGPVIFYPHTDGDELDGFIEAEFEGLEHAQQFIERQRKEFALVDSYAVVQSEGEVGRAQEKATREIERALRALHLFWSFRRLRRAPQLQPIIQIAGDIGRRGVRIYGERLHPGGQVKTFRGHPINGLSGRAISVDSETIAYMKRFGFTELSALLKKPTPTKWEQRILSAVRWAGDARVLRSLEDSFVMNAIALEILMLGEEVDDPWETAGSITAKLGERVAFLLGRDKQERINIDRRVRELYRKRSGIVHRMESTSEEDLRALETYVLQCTSALLRFGFKSDDEFPRWVKEHKFDGDEALGFYREIFGDQPAYPEIG